VFVRGLPAPAVEGPAPLAGLSLFKLLDAFQSVLSRATVKVDHQIDLERFSITDRINQLVDLLQAHKRCTFEQLFEGATSRIDLIITFLALLEMTRLRMTRLEQDAPLEPITIELSLVDAGIMEEAALAAEASFSPRPAEDERSDEPGLDDEENALATRGDVPARTPFEAHDEADDVAEADDEDEEPLFGDSEPHDEDEP
jgi:segregation and condensation protein A